MKHCIITLLLIVTALFPTSLSGASIVVAQPLTQPPPEFLWWKLNEGSGTAVAGSAVTSDDGTTDAAWVTGKSGSGYALDFNGTSHDLGTSGSITFGVSTITVCMWCFFDDVTTQQIVFETTTNYNVSTNAVSVGLNAGKIYGTIRGSTLYRQEDASVSTGSWVHVGVVLNNSTVTGDVKIYLDGVLQAENITINTKTGSGVLAAGPIFVGARNRASFFYNGRIDDVRIYTGDRGASMSAIMVDAQ